MKLTLVFAMLVLTGKTAAKTTPTTNLMITPPGCVHGKTYPHLHDCQHYYSCYRGWFALETCNFGRVYSRSLKRCLSLDSPYNDCKSNEIKMQQIETTTKDTLPDINGSNEMEMQQIEITTTEKPPTTHIDWTFATESTTTSKGNEIEMQQIEITTPDNLPDATDAKGIQATLGSSICLHDETYFYPSNCHLYYLCYYGLMLIEECSTDLVYSRSAKQCVSPTSLDNDCDWDEMEMQQIEITTTEKPPTTDIGDEMETQQIEITTTEKPPTTDIGKYNATQRFKTTKAVPTTTKGDEMEMQQIEITTTEKPPKTYIEADRSRAQHCTDRVVYKDENDCRKYYYCNHGELEHRTCFLDYVFSRRIKRCVPRYSHYADCEQVVRVD